MCRWRWSWGRFCLDFLRKETVIYFFYRVSFPLKGVVGWSIAAEGRTARRRRLQPVQRCTWETGHANCAGLRAGHGRTGGRSSAGAPALAFIGCLPPPGSV